MISKVKTGLMTEPGAARPSFSEKSLGFKPFSDFLRSTFGPRGARREFDDVDGTTAPGWLRRAVLRFGRVECH